MNEPVIFFIEEDDDARPLLRRSLKKLGYHVSLAVDQEDALERVGKGCFTADLVLIELLGKTPEEILIVARNICRTGNLDIPIVVMASRYGADLEGQDVRISEKEYITYLETADQLPNLLARLIRRKP